MIKKYKKLILLFVVLSGFFAFSNQIFAANITFDSPSYPVGVGDEFVISLKIQSQDESINAISGQLIFNDDRLTVKRIETANSIVTAWVEEPYVSGNAVIFSGIMPGGFIDIVDPITLKHSSADLFSLVLKVKKSGSSDISFSDIHVYKNDGLGTEATLMVEKLELNLESTGSNKEEKIIDNNDPEPFTPLITSDKDIYNGQYIVVFSTTDKESGIDHYEVREGLGRWIRTTSPYLLTDQTLRSVVRVKAVDLAGNYRIGIVGNPTLFPFSVFIIPALLILLVLFILWRVYTVYVRKK